jgi:hypothetical protein
MGQKLVRFGSLRLTRSRQDESIEVGEVGSKRPSSGGNGGHFAWCGGLICALLGLAACFHKMCLGHGQVALLVRAQRNMAP